MGIRQRDSGTKEQYDLLFTKNLNWKHLELVKRADASAGVESEVAGKEEEWGFGGDRIGTARIQNMHKTHRNSQNCQNTMTKKQRVKKKLKNGTLDGFLRPRSAFILQPMERRDATWGLLRNHCWGPKWDVRGANCHCGGVNAGVSRRGRIG